MRSMTVFVQYLSDRSAYLSLEKALSISQLRSAGPNNVSICQPGAASGRLMPMLNELKSLVRGACFQQYFNWERRTDSPQLRRSLLWKGSLGEKSGLTRSPGTWWCQNVMMSKWCKNGFSQKTNTLQDILHQKPVTDELANGYTSNCTPGGKAAVFVIWPLQFIKTMTSVAHLLWAGARTMFLCRPH